MVKSIVLSATVGAGSTGTLLSSPIPRRFSPVAIVLYTDQFNINSKFSAFLTNSDTAVTEPQAGDPPPFITGATPTGNVPIAIPLDTTVEYPSRLRLAVAFNNQAATNANVVVWFFYRER